MHELLRLALRRPLQERCCAKCAFRFRGGRPKLWLGLLRGQLKVCSRSCGSGWVAHPWFSLELTHGFLQILSIKDHEGATLDKGSKSKKQLGKSIMIPTRRPRANGPLFVQAGLKKRKKQMPLILLNRPPSTTLMESRSRTRRIMVQ